ncbi:low-density lipoprotein receptor 1-like [Panonychus citri]|uniref:low-density lipoprotein receptor 1-like n=1 Tax=Panonychus citri TaxID=50023 RepID=UPI0023074C5E|nr:low-density lipoprotein receptor 1-like [Panonychus citri]
MIYHSLAIGLILTLTFIQPTYQACNPVYQYECPKSKECIGKAWICDNEPDCSDGEDEEPFMNCKELKCDLNKQFKCSHGQCIPMHWLCDGFKDCPIYHDDEDPVMCSNLLRRSNRQSRN